MRLWDANTGEAKNTLKEHADSIRCVTYSPDGRTLAAGTADDTVLLWDAATGKHRAILTGHTHIVDSVAYSPDGEILVSGSIDGTVRLWSTDKRGLISTLTGHSGYVWSVAYSPDGKTVASGGNDNTSVYGTLRLENLNGHSQGIQAVSEMSRILLLAMSSPAEVMTTLSCSGISRRLLVQNQDR